MVNINISCLLLLFGAISRTVIDVNALSKRYCHINIRMMSVGTLVYVVGKAHNIPTYKMIK